MTTIDGVQAASDLDLLALARSGRSDALAELWRRHYRDAVRAARRWTSNVYDAEDAASEAFSRMLAAVVDGRGPTGSVGGYLAVSVRNIVANRARRREHGDLRTPDPELYARPQPTHTNPVAERAELGLVREAFAALPMRWRIVLWRTAVDRDTNRTLAQEMGMTANAVAALAVRARGGFRAAYLQAHVSRGWVDPHCQPFLVLLPALGSGGVPSPALSDHLTDCARCRERAEELSEVERHLRVLVLPVVLGVVWAKLSSPASAGVAEARRLASARPRGLLLAGAGGLATAAIVGIGVVDPDPAPAPSMAAPRPTSTASALAHPDMPTATPPPAPSPPPPVVEADPPPAPRPPPPVVEAEPPAPRPALPVVEADPPAPRPALPVVEADPPPAPKRTPAVVQEPAARPPATSVREAPRSDDERSPDAELVPLADVEADDPDVDAPGDVSMLLAPTPTVTRPQPPGHDHDHGNDADRDRGNDADRDRGNDADRDRGNDADRGRGYGHRH